MQNFWLCDRYDDLKPDYIDRIHRAREIWLKNLHQPLSLVDLARRVEPNDYLLKRGFKRVFGKTVLHEWGICFQQG